MIDFKKALSEFEYEFNFKFLKPTRKREYVEARALFFYYLYTYCKMRNTDIVQKVKEHTGWNINHATVLHSLNNYEMYAAYNPDLEIKLLCIINVIKQNYDKVTYIREIVPRLSNEVIDDIHAKVSEIHEQMRSSVLKIN